MDLTQPALPTSWYRGEGFQDIVNLMAEAWNNITTTAVSLWNSWSNWISAQLKKVNIFGVNLGQWLDEDPVSASAGMLGAALAGAVGVVVIIKGGVVGRVIGGIKSLWKSAKGLPGLIGLGGLVRAGVGSVQRLWNFNWNVTDLQIREQQKNQLLGLAPVWGEALGSVVGTLCGFSLGRIAYANQAKLIRFNPDLIAKLEELRINNFDEDSELWEEAIENLKSAVASSIRVGINIAALEGYLNARKAIKAIARGVNLSAIWPSLGSQIEKWGEEGSKPWSFASAQEEWVESLPANGIQQFTEEFLEAAQDMCAESTIQVSYAL